MLSDLVVLVLAATVLTLVRPLVESGGSFSGEAFHHLGNEGLVARLWPIAVALIVDRATLTFGMHRVSSRLARDVPTLRRWGWAGLVSQAGIAMGIGASVERSYSRFAGKVGALTIATVAINEMLGPILFKATLDRTGESSTAPEPTRVSRAPPH